MKTTIFFVSYTALHRVHSSNVLRPPRYKTTSQLATFFQFKNRTSFGKDSEKEQMKLIELYDTKTPREEDIA